MRQTNKASVFIVVLAIIASNAGVVFLTREAVALILTTILLSIIVVTFFRFLFAMIRDVRDRTSAYIYIFIALNVASIILLFGNIYRWSGLICSSCSGTEASRSLLISVYFSVVTWTTLGYGDIVPKANSRPVAAIEALVGYLVMALLIAVLSAMVQAGQSNRITTLMGSVRDALQKQGKSGRN